MSLTPEQILDVKKLFSTRLAQCVLGTEARATHESVVAICDMALSALPAGQPLLAKHQPCGCVVCTCEDDEQCQGCGATHCGTHELGRIPNPVYLPAAEGK